MPHAAATPPVPPPAPVPVTGPLAGLLSEQATLWGIFIALARIGMQFLIRFLPHTATLARNYPRHWRALVESNLSFLRVLLTVRFAPERITVAQFRKLWRARQLIESLFGCPLPIFHATANQSPSASPLGARTPSSANATFNQSPSASPENATPLGARTSRPPHATANQHPSSLPNPPSSASLGTPISRLASAPTSSNSHPSTPNTPNIPGTPSTPSVPQVHQVPFCSLSHFPSRSRSDTDSPLASDVPSATPSRSSSRAHKRAPASLQAIIAQLEAQEAQSQSQSQSPHSAFPVPHSSILPPFIPDVNTLHAALHADTLPANCAGALLDHPADTLIKALEQVHALLQAFPQLSPTPSPSQSPSSSPSNLQSAICNLQSSNPQSLSVNPVNNVNNVHPTSDIGHLTLDDSSIPHSEFPTPHSTSPP